MITTYMQCSWNSDVSEVKRICGEREIDYFGLMRLVCAKNFVGGQELE